MVSIRLRLMLGMALLVGCAGLLESPEFGWAGEREAPILVAPGSSPTPQPTDPAQATLLQRLQAVMPEVAVDWIKPGPIPGLYTMKAGRSIVYMDASGRYLFAGGIFDLQAQVNLTALVQGQEAVAQLWGGPLADLAIPLGEADRPDKEIAVFDDVDCPYCKRLHPEIDKLVQAGWRVWVLLYPVQKLHPHAYSKSVGIWCAEDRPDALRRVWSGERAGEKNCAHPLDRIQALAQQVGVAGTPTMVLKSGIVIQGYHNAESIVSMSRPQSAAVAEKP
ncbi:MAG: DsbC family protein [Nitrospirota bacterium]